MYSWLQVTVDGNISSPEKKTLTQLTQTDQTLPFCLFIVVSVCAVGGSLGSSDSCTDFTQCTSLFWNTHAPDAHTHAHTLCVSICPALSLPPTTHSMLYKPYINAPSPPFLVMNLSATPLQRAIIQIKHIYMARWPLYLTQSTVYETVLTITGKNALSISVWSPLTGHKDSRNVYNSTGACIEILLHRSRQT